MNLYLLYAATVAINLLSLVLAIWLGLYLISRSPRYLVAWLTALMLWFMGAMFLNVLLAINPPPAITLNVTWLQWFFPFWPQETLAGTNNNWLQGWSIIPAFALWHHVTVLLLPQKITTWRWVRIVLVYLVAIIATIVQAKAQILFTETGGNVLFLNSLHAGPWYPVFAVALVIITFTSVGNLVYAARRAPVSIAGKQLMLLAGVSLVAGLGGFVSIAASYFMVTIPILVTSSLAGISVGIIGWSVARYSALMEGRTIKKDFLYNLLMLAIVLIIYIPLSLALIKMYNAPMAILAVFPALAVITHFSMAGIYRLIDRFFYTRETQQLRLQLRQLWRNVGTNGALEASLINPMETLCNAVEASYGVLLVIENKTCRKVASCQFTSSLDKFEISKLITDDTLNLEHDHLPPPLDEASLMVPLFGEVDQMGVLLLGQPMNGIHYAPEDVDQILEFADEISETILISQRYTQYLAQITRLMETDTISVKKMPSSVSVEYVEEALRHLNDYSMLADNPLAGMKLVQSYLPPGKNTHLERGKAVHAILLESIEKLKPDSKKPATVIPSEWHPYLILQEAYVEETSNRDIMQKLYISEGTFNRTRRGAIRSLARTLGELEASIS